MHARVGFRRQPVAVVEKFLCLQGRFCSLPEKVEELRKRGQSLKKLVYVRNTESVLDFSKDFCGTALSCALLKVKPVFSPTHTSLDEQQYPQDEIKCGKYRAERVVERGPGLTLAR